MYIYLECCGCVGDVAEARLPAHADVVVVVGQVDLVGQVERREAAGGARVVLQAP